ncbi:hypothetical protein [Evansella cellulosilytica]|uniref:Uncharacterized protein n=1 Tax=Evansella cellulosilytica (strain ATCC 21833 / DSM 2522 / FERM P-1141 / JCM 9156 / N-4) TaxID=649639 RepID=E6TWW6_EVAC2|nr:hypothetical protein [Evansella cellulosilytica]ADU29916.1 hypothetical protein Bcell_1653 [Evansella cellulosilytica DSM 2522]
MSVLPKLSIDYNKEYAIKMSEEIIMLNPTEFQHFKQGESNNISWKWMHLPMKTEGKQLSKIVLHNKCDLPLHVTNLIRFETNSKADIPLVYYSVSKSAIILYDGKDYRLFGSISDQGKCGKFSTRLINMDNWARGTTLPFQPLTKGSNGWGMEFDFILPSHSSTFFYEWELKSEHLYEIEELHSQYQLLLGEKVHSNK